MKKQKKKQRMWVFVKSVLFYLSVCARCPLRGWSVGGLHPGELRVDAYASQFVRAGKRACVCVLKQKQNRKQLEKVHNTQKTHPNPANAAAVAATAAAASGPPARLARGTAGGASGMGAPASPVSRASAKVVRI